MLSSEVFTREIYDAIKNGSQSVENLKNVFSGFDMLIIDDIQFLAGKEKTSEIFFNIFNELVKDFRPIIMTSDKRPDQLYGFEERMISRFNSGLSVEIKRPGNEIAAIILEAKIKASGSEFEFEPEAISYLSLIFNADIRRLEGALQKLYFHAISFLKPNESITRAVCEEVFKEARGDALSFKKGTRPAAIIDFVCRTYGVDERLVRSKSRISSISSVRQICMYLVRETSDLTYSQIGHEFSGRDHSTVMSAISTVEAKANADPLFDMKLREMAGKL
ncbi:unnamed protein product [Didymodactylos carnosus]|uniref:Chromosomal replication initiator DnaA C-terminal domain-containing protein n=1 Tax=Didymodactylos carnosus TaxID=1234261 RepID=A0A8S2CNM4_9BILA|nr:unnamed protein product [Didymodactylos carnosus]CAF3499316.1 unnamed protein product [Didymodactylos carnosus]